MSHAAFLSAFAQARGLGDADQLVTKYFDRYSFQINSRERAKSTITSLSQRLDASLSGLRVLDVGCAYGAFTIEFAKLGARVAGIDVNKHWLDLAAVNAQDEVDVPFLLCDASALRAREQLESYGPFDLVVVNDVFEHIYDTAGLLDNLTHLLAPGGKIYYKIPNGLATRHVLKEGHKGVFGISLLAPDYWPFFVTYPFSIYYRRWQYFQSLFDHFKLSINNLNDMRDADLDLTKRHITNDVAKIRRHLKPENFKDRKQYGLIRDACHYYFEEVDNDLETLDRDDLFRKYRVTFWEGLLTYRLEGAAAASAAMNGPKTSGRTSDHTIRTASANTSAGTGAGAKTTAPGGKRTKAAKAAPAPKSTTATKTRRSTADKSAASGRARSRARS
ncbi:MAG TPA: class I SAM-dependent methyltransferase [Hyphomicrobiales bacterium]|nr:class I SAM-dependent methyltransferase [Hyphomicrobiales bacterium]